MRSVPAGSFERLSSIASLWHAWLRYRAGKRRKPRIAAFDLDADRHLFALRRQLTDGSYAPGPYHLRVVRDPKTRLVAAAPCRDRVLQQALLYDIGPAYERGFIDHSYACDTGRGPHRALIHFLACTRRYRFRLSLDIRRYFASIHHPTLLQLFHRRLRDRRTRALLEQLIVAGGEVYKSPLARATLGLDADPVPAGCGLPLGSFLSHWSGALYLDGLDHFVKRELTVRGYLRYMDDFVLFGDDAARLAGARGAIASWLAAHRRLELNPKRWRVASTRAPTTYLGYRVSRAGIAPGPKAKRRMRRRLRALRGDSNRVERTLVSYRGLFLL